MCYKSSKFLFFRDEKLQKLHNQIDLTL